MSVLGKIWARQSHAILERAIWSAAGLLWLTCAAAILPDPSTWQGQMRPVVPTIAPTPTSTPIAPMTVNPPAPAAAPTLLLQPYGTATETLYWNGDASMDDPLSIPLKQVGRWRLWTLARTVQGESGLGQIELNVSALLVIEPHLPAALTAGDEIDMPVTFYNALPLTQTVRLTVTLPSGVRLRQRGRDVQQAILPPAQNVTLSAPIQVIQGNEWGRQVFTWTVSSSDTTQVITRTTEIGPAGRPVWRHYNRQTDETDSYKIRIPWGTARGLDRMTLRVYASWDSVLSDGLIRALAHLDLSPWQPPQIVSATTYQNIAHPAALSGAALEQQVAEMMHLALLYRYASNTDLLSPLLQAQIEQQASLDVQRMLAWQTPEGGLAAWGRLPADPAQTAMALLALAELWSVMDVDKTVMDRAAAWLLDQQVHAADQSPGLDLTVSALTAWSILYTDQADTPAAQVLLKSLRHNVDQARDPFALACVVHALLTDSQRTGGAQNAESQAILTHAVQRLAELATVSDGLAYWSGAGAVWSGAAGQAADVERTALAVGALLRAQSHPALAAQGLAWLIDQRDAQGLWGSPQATQWSLYALSAAGTLPKSPQQDANVRVTAQPLRSNEVWARQQAVIPADDRSVWVFDLGAPAKGYNDIEIAVSGGPVWYQLVAEYVLPWNLNEPLDEDILLTTRYTPADASVGQTITATVGIAINRPGTAGLVMVELGLPPGCRLVWEDWEDMVERGEVAWYEWERGNLPEAAPARLRVYLADLSADQPRRLVYRLRPMMPVSATIPSSWAIILADPRRPGFAEAVTVRIR